jgi:hypothetical protein
LVVTVVMPALTCSFNLSKKSAIVSSPSPSTVC